MAYNHGDPSYKCDTCGREMGINPFSSAGIMDLKRFGWIFYVEEKLHLIEEKIIKSKFTGDRVIKAHKKIEKTIRIRCDQCIRYKERREKLSKIIEKMGS